MITLVKDSARIPDTPGRGPCEHTDDAHLCESWVISAHNGMKLHVG